MTAWKVAWITGASSGIGWETANALAAKGVTVAISARHPPNEALPDGVRFYKLDVTNEPACAAVVAQVEAELGPIDLTVFGAGTYLAFARAEFSLIEFKRHMDVNYFGVLNCIAAVLPVMKARGHGHMSWIASVAGFRGLPKAAYYGPTKAALINLAESLAVEFATFGLRVSVINPGFVETPMTAANKFKMPMLMSPAAAGAATVRGLEQGRFEISYPLAFVLWMKFLRLLPNAVYLALARRL
jgi:NAD(P)-dependent dehydrogenase (short-subunit alcohol dehydrogenase family)